MTPMNLQLKHVLIVCLMLFFCFLNFSAFAGQEKLLAQVADLLSSKTTDYSGVVSQLSDRQLPLALAAAELLKFKAAHSEITLSVDEAESFAGLINQRIEHSQVISFKQNDICCSPVESWEIVFEGQKLIVPAHFTADLDLAIVGYQPTGEAGSIFPFFCIDVFSQTPLVTNSFKIDGETIHSGKIKIARKSDSENYQLSYQSDFDVAGILQIGTHTAEINLKNQAGEQISRSWQFTVGIYDCATEKLPINATLLKVVDLPLNKVLPVCSSSAQLSVMVFQSKTGQIFTEYRLKSETGRVFTSQNLAFIGRQIISGGNRENELTISPNTTHAFAGNHLGFAYSYTGAGKIVSEEWAILNGSQFSNNSNITMLGDVYANCTIIAEYTSADAEGNPIVYQVSAYAKKKIDCFEVNPQFKQDRKLLLSNDKNGVISFSGIFWLWGDAAVYEGKEYNYDGGGNLIVEKMRWKIHASEGEPEIANPLATSTSLIFNKPGFAEIVLDAKMIWKQAGETYISDFKPQVSGLFAFYPVSGKANFSQFPAGQISLGRRIIRIKSYEFTVKNQHRILNNANDCILAEPLLITSSEISPASHPIQITKVIPEIFQIPGANQLEHIDAFSFLTPMALEADNIALQLGGKLYDTADPDHPNNFGFATIPSIQVFSENELMELSLNPAEPITTYEGVETSFDAEVVAAAGIGSGHLCATENTLNLLKGYRVSSVDYIHWFETPLGEEGDWKEKATRGLDYSHIFEPIIGPGSYTMNCGFVLKLRESDSGDEVPVYLENAVPVDVLPGLRIFSPINELAYPLNISLKVKTSFDKEKNIWKKIQWRLNGKEYNHGLDEGPFYIELNHTGKWSLQAELTIKNPQTNEDMILKDRVDFTVNPVEISLTPTRKVLDFSMQKSQELSLNITLNGKKVEKPGKPVEWNDEGLKAVVDPIEWFSATNPDGCAVGDHDESSLIAGVDFTKTGAITMLATITVRLIDGEDYFRRRHKGFEDEFEEPIFSVPAVRADLWAVSTGSLNEINGLFPEQSIAQAYRTYRLDSFEFNLNHGQTILEKFSRDKGISPTISIAPALAGIASISANLNFEWKVVSTSEIEKKIEEPTRMVIKPSKPCDYRVILQPLLDFGSAGSIPLSKIETPANAVSLYSLIETRVDPASFTITVGETKTLKYKVSSLESSPQPPNQEPDHRNAFDSSSNSNVIYLLDKSYSLTIENVEWSDNQNDPTPTKNAIEGNPYEFHATIIGKIEGEAVGHLRVTELYDVNQNRSWSSAFLNKLGWGALSQDISLKLYVNEAPIENAIPCLGQKIKLSCKAFDHQGNELPVTEEKWSIQKPVVADFIIKHEDLPTGVLPYGVVLELANFNQKEIVFYLYDPISSITSKTVAISCKVNNATKIFSQQLKYERPFIEQFYFHQEVPTVHLNSDVWWVGYDGFKKVYSSLGINNQTQTPYEICYTQLLKYKDIRVLDTVQEKAVMNDWQLDTRFQSGGKNILVQPLSAVVTDEFFFEDAPESELHPNNLLKKYTANMEYPLWVMAKPQGVDSIWVPIHYCFWRCQKETEKVNGYWSLDGSSSPSAPTDVPFTVGMSEAIKDFKLGFPAWQGIFITGETKLQWEIIP